MHIMADVDDVLYGWFDRAHEVSIRHGLVPTGTPLPTQWHCHVDYNVPEQAWVDVLQAATADGSLYDGPPLPGAVEALQALRDAGHVIHIVTARGFFKNGDIVRKHTVDWVRDFEIPHDSLTFIKDKTRVKVDIAVDDGAHNVKALHAAGIPVALMDAPHNQNEEHYWRVSNMGEFAEAVLLGRW